ncbi:Acyltransferase abl6 [Plenodomus lingam]|uniref:Acyltransferase abl6 n=1 Tax=Leptosphaeria maculans (strain JN3 / isolate v23.1.3 / race Av1-4-5-6-7-8) TaxID=985895 RepID=ABL6_LEPMJ|nr:similar to transferase family protein [Plenodomus lingam JN3]E5A7D7.1 RecName: Full=Acyltransferase abl6; AltName: Full=Abscisic acid biosynthesis cluster protein 6 [Plenodomus lingam JN3]KAH9872375.1 Acyltransferase abl6 [Plenodomus lingam]CBX99532.1 similar to transferase family protein [Plenodomus lingam JN3]
MKVEVMSSHRVHPEHKKASEETAILPVIDSWYCYWRTLAAIYLFDAYSGPELYTDLRQSLSKTLDDFPQLAGTLDNCNIQVEDKSGRSVRRTRVTWGGNTLGGEFIEAKTNARVRSLLPPSIQNISSFAWDRSDRTLRPLFPATLPETSGIRVQVTSFKCGGFGIALDMDHALADAHTVGLFIGHWSAIHTRMFTSTTTFPSQISLPNVMFNPQFVEKKVHETDNTYGSKMVMLDRARELPTRRPDLRDKSSQRTMQGNMFKPPPKPSAGVPYLLHFSASEYERITRGIQQATASPQITDQVAFVSFLWAALNKARARCSVGQAVDLHLPTSFRWTLGLPEGLIGSPLVAVMMDGGPDGEVCYTDPVVLATIITKTLERYTEDALLAIVYDASLRDSPASMLRGFERRERMEFTSGVGFGSDKLSFGCHSPVFVGPIILPVDNLFIMAEGMRTSEAHSSKWYKHGANIFVSLPQDVFRALLADPALINVELLGDI